MQVVAALSVFAVGNQLISLTPIDILILVLYFAVVVFIGFYVKGSTNTSEQFFLAGSSASSSPSSSAT
jgi:solute:Na+ symporter, SSS family